MISIVRISTECIVQDTQESGGWGKSTRVHRSLVAEHQLLRHRHLTKELISVSRNRRRDRDYIGADHPRSTSRRFRNPSLPGADAPAWRPVQPLQR